MSQLESSAGCPAITDLTLARFPHQSDDPSLQAWEAADEYLLQQIDPTQAQGPRPSSLTMPLARWPALCTICVPTR